jgi:hypothetical protein
MTAGEREIEAREKSPWAGVAAVVWAPAMDWKTVQRAKTMFDLKRRDLELIGHPC